MITTNYTRKIGKGPAELVKGLKLLMKCWWAPKIVYKMWSGNKKDSSIKNSLCVSNDREWRLQLIDIIREKNLISPHIIHCHYHYHLPYHKKSWYLISLKNCGRYIALKYIYTIYIKECKTHSQIHTNYPTFFTSPR